MSVVTAALSAIVIGILTSRIPATNTAHTDIVGYPIFANFDANLYSDTWYLWVLGWPLLSLVLFGALRHFLRAAGVLSRAGAAFHVSQIGLAVAAPDEPADEGVARVAAAARLAGVGLVWGFAGAITRGNQGNGFWRDLLIFGVIYALTVLALTWVICKVKPWSAAGLSPARVLSALNALGAALTVLGLVAVSQVTALVTLSDSASHPMHWFPLVIGLPATALLTGVVGVGLWRARDSGVGQVRTVERRALFLVAVPVALYLSTALLVGGQGVFDVFELGQEMTTLRLLHLGEFPFRDFLPFHGLFVDTLLNALGYRLLSPSAWGSIAGGSLVITPLTWVAIYLFAYRVVGASWVATLTGLFLFFNTTAMTADGTRLLVWPLILVLLAVSFDRRSRAASFGAGATLTIFAVLVPEATYVLPACGAALVAHDAYHARWRRRMSVAREFRLSLWALAGGVAVATALFAVLASAHSVGGFLDYYLTLIPGHGLEGTLPISPGPPFDAVVFTQQYVFWIVAPGLAIIIGVAIVVGRVRLGHMLRTTDFLLIASGLFTVLYYGSEFLARADLAHAALAYAGAIPLLILVAWEGLRWANERVRALLRGSHAGRLRWPLVCVGAVIAAITTSSSLPSLVGGASANFRATAATEPWLPTLGYMDAADQGEYTDIGTFLATFLKPGQEIYDFSNQPGLYYFVLDYRPASRHYEAAMDYSELTQRETIADLDSDRPLFVIMYGTAPGALPSWDEITNAVRDYDISEYVLDRYRPFASIDGQIIYVRDDSSLSVSPSLRAEFGPRLTVSDLPFEYADCAWGYAPEFLTAQPSHSGGSSTVGGANTVRDAWTLEQPVGQTWADYQWIQLTIAPGSPAATFTIDDEEVAGQSHDVTFETLAGGQVAYRFPIGACTQWHGYSRSTLRLSSSVPVTVSHVELLR